MLEIILFLYGIGKQLAVEWDVLKGLTEPTDASSSQHTQLQELGASLVAISPQTPDHSPSLVEKQQLTCTVLSDGGNRVARAYGLVFTIDEAVRAAHRRIGANLPAFNGDDSWELPMAGTFLVDQSGTIRLASVDPDFSHRLDPSVVIAGIKALKGKLAN